MYGKGPYAWERRFFGMIPEYQKQIGIWERQRRLECHYECVCPFAIGRKVYRGRSRERHYSNVQRFFTLRQVDTSTSWLGSFSPAGKSWPFLSYTCNKTGRVLLMVKLLYCVKHSLFIEWVDISEMYATKSGTNATKSGTKATMSGTNASKSGSNIDKSVLNGLLLKMSRQDILTDNAHLVGIFNLSLVMK